MSKVLAFCNHKGGVGKTTSVMSIGSILAAQGYSVLLVDMDAQQNLTASLSDGEYSSNTYTALRERANLPQVQIKENLYLCPASLDLAAIESEIGGTIGRERALEKALQPIRDKYDYILIDCAPSLGLLLINALTAADLVFIPLIAESLPYKGLASLESVIAQVREYLNPRLTLGGVFFTRWAGRNLNKQVADAAAERYGDLLLHTRIRENIAIAEAPLEKKSITDYAEDSNGAADYRALTAEVVQRCNMVTK